MGATDRRSFAARSKRLDVDGLDVAAVRRHRLPAAALRTLQYMQDIETHTVVYLRTLLHTRVIDDPEVTTFLSCWFHEELAHGEALAAFLDAAGGAVVARCRSRTSWRERAEQALTGWVAGAWPDFAAVHMTWGAINELGTLHGYQRLSALAGHPVLSTLLASIARDESRHFDFYFHQAMRRLQRPGAGRIARLLVDRFWRPVGSGVQPDEAVRFVAGYLFDGPDGRAAARRIDRTIRRLPGFEDVALVEAWIDRHVHTTPGCAATEPRMPAVPVPTR